MAILSPEVWPVSADDEENCAISFSPYLDTGELIASGTVTEITSTDLTITNVAKSTGALTILGESVPTAEALQFTVSGMLAGVDYKLAIQVTTDSTPARVKNYCQRMETAAAC